MMRVRRHSLAGVLSVAVLLLTQVAAAESVTTSVTAATLATQDTTFTPAGSYELNVAVEGQGMVMTFVVEKKADGTFAGTFRHAEMGEFSTTSFKADGRQLTMSIETPGGPANIVMTVQADNTVTGEWSMTGDGSKITGKKIS